MKNFKYLTLILLTAIFIIGATLRIAKLSTAPVDFWLDEAAIAIDSNSLLKTGKDHYGIPFPLAFRSVGDYKAPLLEYVMIPAIATFGLTEFGTRITVAIFSSLTILLVFYLIKTITDNNWVSLLAALSLAISPWHIKFSRATYEAELALFLVILGVILLLKSLNSGKWLWASAISLTLAVYAYHAEKVFVPVLVIGLFIIFRSQLLKRKKQLIIAVIVGIIVIAPLALSQFSKDVRIRAETGNLTKNMDLYRTLDRGEQPGSPAQSILSNNGVLITNFWFKNYIDYFDPNFLFTNGMGYTLPNAPDLGLLYLFELPFFLVGGYILFFTDILVKGDFRRLIIFWILIGPLAASLANNYQHALRFLTIIPMPHLLSATGIWFTFSKIRDHQARLISGTVFLGVVFLSVIYFTDLYFVQHPLIFSEYRMDGWKDAAKYAVSKQSQYKQVVLDPRFGTLGPYTYSTPDIYMLFYSRADPKLFQDSLINPKLALNPPINFKVKFIDWTSGKDLEEKDTLFIGSPWVLPAKDSEILQKFYLYNGKEILRAVNPKP